LPGQALPAIGRQVVADAEDAQLIMSEFGNLFPRFAEQDIDEMPDAKALPGAIHRR
jgi:hypothetical protein